MEFYVIYSADALTESHLSYCRPRPELCEKLTLTEDGESEYTYLEGVWENAVHEKWVGFLTRAEFEKFVWDTCLTADDVETMGSLTEMGWMPAISFNGDDEDSICNAYVTPHCTGISGTEAQWDRLKAAIVSKWGY